jgi:hypothetical protein
MQLGHSSRKFSKGRGHSLLAKVLLQPQQPILRGVVRHILILPGAHGNLCAELFDNSLDLLLIKIGTSTRIEIGVVMSPSSFSLVRLMNAKKTTGMGLFSQRCFLRAIYT